tara:strand:- start:135 stop:806 length:672 start_codon:yes stop_codon:yes gene_type:complete
MPIPVMPGGPVEVPLPDISTRYFSKRGSTVNLRTAYYVDSTLTNPASISGVEVYRGTTLLTTVAGANITTVSTGIKQATYAIDADASLGTYTDKWVDVVLQTGDNPVSYTFEFYVVAGDVPVTSTSDECTIYEYIRDDQGKPLANITGYAYVTDRPYTIDDASATEDATNVRKALSDDSGRVAWRMPIGADVVVDVPDAGIFVKKVVPDQAQVQITSMNNSTE